MGFWHFAAPHHGLGPPLAGSYNVPLLLLSITIACFAGFAALSVVNRFVATQDRPTRALWLAAGAAAMGCGIWAMHFTGMLAFSLPVPIYYVLRTTLLSLIPAILASGAALFFIAQPKLGWKRLQLGALLMATGIGTMHYMGMEGMVMQGMMHYNLALFCLSIVVAHLLSMTAIYVRFVMSARLSLPAFWVQAASAVIMGFAVAGMHYTAMAAARFYAMPDAEPLGGEYSNMALGSLISGFSILIVSLSLLAALVDRRIADSEQRRRSEEARANTILNTTADGILALDGRGKILSSNLAAEFIFGYALKEIVDQPIGLLVPQLDGGLFMKKQAAADAGHATHGNLWETYGRRADGGTFPLEISMNSVPDADSEIIVLSLRDMTERKRAQEVIERTEERLKIVAQATTDAIWDWDLVTDMVWWNEGVLALFGYDPGEIEQDSGFWTSRIHPEDRQRVLAGRQRAMDGGAREWAEEYRFLRSDGSIAHVLDRGFLIRDVNGKAVRMVGGMSDITKRKQAEAEIEYLAFYDSLTGLPNRSLLQDRLQHALASCARNGSRGALMFIDLDGFKTLNDTFGHSVGDQLLQQVAQLLKGCTRESDTVARLGGDEFVVVLEDLGEEAQSAAADARRVGEKILDAFRHPFMLEEHQHYTTPSIGITLFGESRVSVDELLKQADIAMYQTKAEGGATLRFFDPEMQAKVHARVQLESQLRQALGNGEFMLHYQPQVNVDGVVIGAEALVRWHHPERGLVSPADFIPLAEETGLIQPLGYWILETVCRQMVTWRDAALTRGLSVAVNVSAQQLRQPDFVEQVLEILRRTGADPSLLKLELTENVLVSHMEDTIAKMSRLRQEGVGFSLDDFGTGYSSLFYLKRLPLDQLKIDRSFVKDVLTDGNDAAIARMIIALAHLLGLCAVAEGVETEEQRDFLARHGCEGYQGYLYGQPLPAAEFEALLAEYGQVVGA